MTVGAELTYEQKNRERALLRVSLRAAVARVSDEQLEAGRPRLLAERLVKTELDNSQIRNIENVAYTTDKISDITDLIKKLIGRDTRARRWAKDNIGQEVIAALEALRSEANEIVAGERDRYDDVIDADLPRRVQLELCREFVKHLAAEFMYRNREA